jgi:hypothetical protein
MTVAAASGERLDCIEVIGVSALCYGNLARSPDVLDPSDLAEGGLQIAPVTDPQHRDRRPA